MHTGYSRRFSMHRINPMGLSQYGTLVCQRSLVWHLGLEHCERYGGFLHEHPPLECCHQFSWPPAAPESPSLYRRSNKGPLGKPFSITSPNDVTILLPDLVRCWFIATCDTAIVE